MTYEIRFKGAVLEGGFTDRRAAFKRAKELRATFPEDKSLPLNKAYVWRSDQRITDSVSFVNGKITGSHYHVYPTRGRLS